MRIEDQDTQPLPVISFRMSSTDTANDYFRRLKALSDATGVRFLFLFLSDQKQRRQMAQETQRAPVVSATFQAATLHGQRRLHETYR